MSHLAPAGLGTILLVATSGMLHAQYPDTVLVGDPALRAASLQLTHDTVDNFVITDGNRRPTGSTIRSITREDHPGESRYLIRTRHWAMQGDTSTTTMAVRVDDLSLVFHRVKAAHDSAAVTASRGHLTAWVVLPNQPIRLVDLTLDRPVFPVEGQIPWLFPLLPLTPGYRAAIPHFSQWNGQESWSTIAVLGSERVTIGRGTYDCWVVDTGPLGPPGYRMFRWIDRQSRRVVQSVLRGQTGGDEYWSTVR